MYVDPCKAVIKHYSIGIPNEMRACNSPDINSISDSCYRISKAYGDVYGKKVEEELDSKCSKMLSEYKASFGRDDCNLRRPVKPVVFNQVPHFFPELLKSGASPEQAYKGCISKCKDTRYGNTCSKYCKMDYDALVINDNKENQNDVNTESSDTVNTKDEHYYILTVIITVIMLCILLGFWHSMSRK